MAAQSDLEKENLELRTRIELLQQEIQTLKVDRVVKVVQQKEILPAGYLSDMKRLKVLEKENQRFRRLLEFGNITVLESLISDFKTVSKPRLEKIVQEYQFCYADQQERLLIKEFISYLQAVVKQLQEFLFLDENGEKNDQSC
ncbi:hypothetical protein [Anaerospora hongkongensis]|uniref:hypothetical protein n=1 Tax=Anaerospora hongkongensis TaxID=244830 RepID=UPI002FDB069F